MQIKNLKHICIGGSVGILTGYSYNKYTKVASLGLGIGFLATRMKDRIIKFFDFNHDGKLDEEDIKILEEKTGYDIDLTTCISFVGGFGLGYLGGMIH